jgi:hypothetical protein
MDLNLKIASVKRLFNGNTESARDSMGQIELKLGGTYKKYSKKTIDLLSGCTKMVAGRNGNFRRSLLP